MRKSKQLLIFGIITIVVVTSIIIGLTYAFFTAEVEGNEEAMPTVVETANLRLVFHDTQILSLMNALPGSTASKSFTVTNTSNIKLKYDINIIDVYNNFQNEELVYSLTSINGGATVTEEVLPSVDKILTEKIEINPGVTHEYTLIIKFKETGENQNYNQGAVFTGKLQINTSVAYSENVIFEIEQSVGEVYRGDKKEVSLLGSYYGEVKCESQNPVIAECSSNQEKIIVEGKSRGVTDLKITEDIKNIELMYSIRVLEPNLGLESTVGEVILTKTKGIAIIGEDYGTLSCETSNASIALCSISGNTLSITGTGIGTTTVKVKESNQNLEVNYTITVQDVTLGLSPTSGTVIRTKTINSTISGSNYGTLSCSTSNATIATCSITGTTLTVTGMSTGNTNITVKESTLNKQVNYSVTVVELLYTYGYTGNYQTFTTLVTGTYSIELWGSGRKTSINKHASGAYTKGNISLSAGEKIYIYVGATNNSFNGGGTAVGSSPGGISYGHGATDIRLVEGVWNNDTSLNSRIMVAGAGGLNGTDSKPGDVYSICVIGGSGNFSSAGGLTGYPATFATSCSSSAYNNVAAGGGTQTSGGARSTTNYGSSSLGTNGSFGIGGSGGPCVDSYYTCSSQNAKSGRAGSGGYYGGGGCWGPYAGQTSCMGAGGGSSFISGHAGSIAITSASNRTPKSSGTELEKSKHYSGKFFTSTVMIDGAGYRWTNVKGNREQMPIPTGGNYTLGEGHTGNGYAKITFIN